jgi:phosphoglucomutase/phosphomannomutase
VTPPKPDEIQVVYTPLHGVGAMTAMEVLVQQGFRVLPVVEQMKPDGMFTNVTQTPNPEVPVSMDRAEALAKKENADLVLSTDPDADRLGAMIPFSEVRGQKSEVGDQKSDVWRFVTGNEIAALLTHFKLSKLAEQGEMPGSPIVIKTEVTTGLITRIARHFRAQVVDNLLVGFKYIADVLWHLEQSGAYEDVRGRPQDFVIGGEESHGILVTPEIRDKDAAGGALLMAELALDQKRRGKTVLDYLEAIYRQFGYFRNEVVPVVMTGIEGRQNMTRMLNQLRQTPLHEIGGLSVTDFEDLRDEHGRLGPIKGATDAASRNVLIFHLGEQARVALRPSGTEPKAKAYIEVCSPPCPAGASAEQWQKIRTEVDSLFKRIEGDFLRKVTDLAGIH